MSRLRILAAATLLALAACTSDPAPASFDPATETPTTSPPAQVLPVSATSDLLVTGNSFWGRRIETAAEASPLGKRWPFSRLHEFHKSRYDAWVTGLECPTVPGVHATDYENETLLKFNCDPAYLSQAAKWFDIVSLANNHTDNQGPAGVVATRRQLDSHGILHFGDPDPQRLDQVCRVVPVAADVLQDDGTVIKGHLPLGFCGYHGVFEVPPDDALDVMQRLSRRVPVLALPHSGLEYVAQETGIKVDLYRGMIDHGADAVLGDHAHWVQNSEAYNGHLIVYSMGNFMFDQQDDNEVTRSAAIKVRLTVVDQPGLEEWLALGERCAEVTDCTAVVQQERLPKPTVRFGFGVVGTTNPGLLTRPASAEQTEAILDRLDWARTTAGLQAPYRGIR